MKNVQDGISRPLGSREIQKTKVGTDLLDTLYISIYVLKYTNMQVCECEYADMQECVYVSMHIEEYADMQVCKFKSMQVCKYICDFILVALYLLLDRNDSKLARN